MLPMKRMLYTESSSESETEEIAREFASIVRPGDLIALYGPLGSGKTTFIRGLAMALRCRQPVRSPTFNLVNEYMGDIPLYHIDFYRLESDAEIIDLGWTDYLNSDGVVAIEWAERVESMLPENRFEVRLIFAGDDGRIIEVSAVGSPGNR